MPNRSIAFDRASNIPWAIQPDALRVILQIAQRNMAAPEVRRAQLDQAAGDDVRVSIRSHLSGEAPESIRARQGARLENSFQTSVRDGVAILPVIGPLFPYASVFDMLSGATSLQMLALDLQRAVDDPNVKSIVLEIDSPGGVAMGINEFADQVRAAAAKKRVVAYVAGMACSAAYWIATAADEIVTDAAGILGSIGVVLSAWVQEQPDQDGYRQFEIVSSNAAKKRVDPRTDEGRATIRAEIDEIEAVFLDAVARGRKVSVDDVKERFGQGGVMIGANAVRAGLADRTGSFESLVAELAAAGSAVSTEPGAAASTTETPNMTGTTTTIGTAATTLQPNAPLTATQLREQNPTAAMELAEAGAAAERNRIAGLEAAAMPGFDKLLADAKADGKTTGPELAAAIIAETKAKGGKLLASLAADDPKNVTATTAPATDKPDTAGNPLTVARDLSAAARKVQDEAHAAGRHMSAAEAVEQVLKTSAAA